MLKIVVFDGGWGGELAASFLQQELKIVEVIKVVDWLNIPYDDKTPEEICVLAQKYLAPFVGKVDLIVLGGYTVSLALDRLQEQYPQQMFVGMGINYNRLLKLSQPPKQIALLCNSSLVETSLCTKLQDYLPESTLIIPDSSGWEQLINTGEMTAEILRLELQDYFALSRPSQHPTSSLIGATTLDQNALTGQLRLQVLRFLARNYDYILQTKATIEAAGGDHSATYPQGDACAEMEANDYNELASDLLRPDTILMLNTHFWEIEPEIQELFGRGVRVIDFKEKLLHDVCLALGLKGVDGALG